MERIDKIMEIVKNKEYYENLRKIDIIDLHNDICTMYDWAEDFIRDMWFDWESFIEGYSDSEIEMMTNHDNFRNDRYFWYHEGLIISNDFLVYEKAKETIEYFANDDPEAFYEHLERQYNFQRIFDDDE